MPAERVGGERQRGTVADDGERRQWRERHWHRLQRMGQFVGNSRVLEGRELTQAASIYTTQIFSNGSR
jgi:hypothetical protein